MGKSIFETFATDTRAENEGQWFRYGTSPLGGPERFKLARMSRSNKKYIAALQRMSDEYGKQLDYGTVDDEESEAVLLDVFCSTILVDWDNITGPDGTHMPHTKENAKALMTKFDDLYRSLQAQAQDRTKFLEKQLKEDTGN